MQAVPASTALPAEAPAAQLQSDDVLSEEAPASLREQSEQAFPAAPEDLQDPLEDLNVDAATVMSEPDYINVTVHTSDAPAAPEQAVPAGPPKSFADLVKSWPAPPPSAPLGGAAAGPKRTKRSSPPPAAAETASAAPEGDSGDKASSSAPARKGKAPASSSLFVNKLPEGASEGDLTGLFAEFGAIKGVSVNPKGFGFVDFQEASSVTRVLARVTESGPFSVLGSSIRVEERAAKPPTAGGGRGSAARGASSGRGGRSNGSAAAGADKAQGGSQRKENVKRDRGAAAGPAKK